MDVTSEVTLGQTTEVSYRGLYAGAPPTVDCGTIDLVSYLVIHRP